MRVPKDWGTTGFVVNTDKVQGEMTTWKEFWDRTRDDLTGRVMVHDYQLTTIGNALKYFGYSFNSIDQKELAEAEKLLIEAKPHLFAINCDYQPVDAQRRRLDVGLLDRRRHAAEPRHAGDAIRARQGGRRDLDRLLRHPEGRAEQAAAYALINFMLDPAVNAKEVQAHGYPSTDQRPTRCCRRRCWSNPILYPAAELLSPLEFGAAATLTDPLRAELMARFKSA